VARYPSILAKKSLDKLELFNQWVHALTRVINAVSSNLSGMLMKEEPLIWNKQFCCIIFYG
jgi:hypothetical protein